MSAETQPLSIQKLRLDLLKKQLEYLSAARDVAHQALMNCQEDRLLNSRCKLYLEMEKNLTNLINNIYFLEIGQEPYIPAQKPNRVSPAKPIVIEPQVTKADEPINRLAHVLDKIDSCLHTVDEKRQKQMETASTRAMAEYIRTAPDASEEEVLWHKLIYLRQHRAA